MSVVKDQLTIYRCCFCQKLMVDGRSDKKTCSPACRLKLHRWKKKIDILEVRAHEAIDELTEYLKFYDAVPRAISSIKSIKTRADASLKQADIQGVK